MTIKKDWILLLIIVILGFLLLRKCGGNSGTVDPIDLTPDTTYIQGPIDTVLFHDTVFEYKYLTTTITDVIHDTITGDTIRTYSTPVTDSLLEGKITTKVKGFILSTDFSYKPKFPKFITRVDTLKITEPVPVPKNKWGLYAGGIIGGNANMFTLQPSLLVKTSGDIQMSAGYDLIHKTYHVGVYTKLKWPNFTRNRN
jgi:hypothetical protein